MLLNDTEAKVDLLNFTATANAVASMIRSSEEDPLSIGVFGDWGSGKSSLIHLIKNSLETAPPITGNNTFAARKKFIRLNNVLIFS